MLRGGVPVAGVVVEFSGGPGSWVQRTYSAARGGGAHLDGTRIGVSACTSLQRTLLVSTPSCAADMVLNQWRGLLLYSEHWRLLCMHHAIVHNHARS